MHKALIKKKYSTIKPLDQVTEMNIPRATENSTCSGCHASSLFKTLFFHWVSCPTAPGGVVQKLIFPSVSWSASICRGKRK